MINSTLFSCHRLKKVIDISLVNPVAPSGLEASRQLLAVQSWLWTIAKPLMIAGMHVRICWIARSPTSLPAFSCGNVFSVVRQREESRTAFPYPPASSPNRAKWKKALGVNTTSKPLSSCLCSSLPACKFPLLVQNRHASFKFCSKSFAPVNTTHYME